MLEITWVGNTGQATPFRFSNWNYKLTRKPLLGGIEQCKASSRKHKDRGDRYSHALQ